MRKIKRFFRSICYDLSKPLKCLYNLIFTSIYPFWRARNAFSGEAYYTFNSYNLIPAGWRKAFGKKLTKDLKRALKKDNLLKIFWFFDIKEKYGQLCLYGNMLGDETEKVLRYYENLSLCYCINCGKPVRYITRTNYISYLCEKCFDKSYKKFYRQRLTNDFEDFKKECRLTKEDIPQLHKYTRNEETKEIKEITIDLGIDFNTLWNL